MRLTVEAFRRIITLTIDKASDDEPDTDQPTHRGAMVEQANTWRDDHAADCFGFTRARRDT